MTFITGEKIQYLCDHFLGNSEDFQFNPTVLKYHGSKCVPLSSINHAIDNKDLVFCYTHLIDNIDLLISKLSFFKNSFKLIFHNSDSNFNKTHLVLFDRLPLLSFIYCQNMNVTHDKVKPLPIGLANSQWSHGDLSTFQSIYETNTEKTKDIFFNFSIATNKNVRQDCYNKLVQKQIPWVSSKPYKKYLEELKQYKYCICPEGHGLDTHRFWECLYLNVIPICRRNVLVEYYSKYFPVIILENWDDLDVQNLIKNYQGCEFDKRLLSMNYISKYIHKKYIKMDNHINIFTEVYETKEWGDNNNEQYRGSSGGGSTVEFNQTYIKFLREFMDKNRIKKVIDLGCGDWQFSHLVYENIEYHGYDAYEKVILSNMSNYPQYTFTHLDILKDVEKIQNGDLCILKDILQHWTCQEITFFMDKLLDLKKFKHIIINNSSAQRYDNQDEPYRSRPLSIKFYPLKKYNFEYLFSYHDKEVSLLTC